VFYYLLGDWNAERDHRPGRLPPGPPRKAAKHQGYPALALAASEVIIDSADHSSMQMPRCGARSISSEVIIDSADHFSVE
jgi:hypothetical protein